MSDEVNAIIRAGEMQANAIITGACVQAAAVALPATEGTQGRAITPEAVAEKIAAVAVALRGALKKHMP
jgi:hypothetical protein